MPRRKDRCWFGKGGACMSIKTILNPYEYLKKKKELKEYEHKKRTGLVIHCVSNNSKKNDINNFLANTVINFFVCFGTLGCFVSPFDIKANMFVLAIATLLFSLMTAFLYYNNVVKMIGYVVVFSCYIFLIMQNKQMIKGGFAHICNKIMEFLERDFSLPIERGYDIYGYSEKSSVTLCLCFILFAVILMFNIAITESKGFIVVLLFTFPIIQAGMYFEREINVLYFSLYFIGLISLHFMRCSEHYKMETKKKNGYLKKQKNNNITYNYVSDGRYNISFVLSIAVIVLCFSMIVSLIYPQKKSDVKLGFEYLKEDTREYAEQAAILGFWGMIGRNGGAGGVGRSRLGQNKYVALDYNTDMLVQTNISVSESSLYLKAYNGTYYNNEYWEVLSESDNDKVALKDYGLKAEEVMELPVKLNDYYELSFLEENKYIVVSNIGANSMFPYFPYYSIVPGEEEYTKKYDDEYTKGLEKNYSMIIEYLPINNIYSLPLLETLKKEIQDKKEILKNNSEINNYIEMEEKYSDYVKKIYLDVPKENIKSIEEFCNNYELNKDTEEIEKKVCEIFDKDYEYTLIPGKTPKNKEFVNYFLSESKKGYCVYFASSATLIFRYLGIPARYCGGYVLQESEFDVPEKTLSFEESKLSHWLKKYDFNEWEYPYGLCEYELDDSMAHAWVEIYIDGFGWLPVEVTPGDYTPDKEEDEESENGFIQNLLSGNIITSEGIDNVKNVTISFVKIVVYLVIAFVCIYIILGFIVRYIRKRQRDVNKKYIYLNKCAKYIGIKQSDSRSYEEFAHKLAEKNVVSLEKIMQVVRIIEKNKFSVIKINKEEESLVSSIINEISYNIYKDIKWYKKIVYRFISWL